MALVNRRHHPIFERFEAWQGVVPPGTHANWLGVFTDVRYANWQASPVGVVVQSELPSLDTEEYAEWIDLLEAVSAAGDRFTIVELGAGFGRWLVDGAAAYRQLRPDGRLLLVGVEGEPTHYRWMLEHVERNVADVSTRLIEGAVAEAPGRMLFDVGDPARSYGHGIRSRASWRDRYRRHSGCRVVNAVTLGQVFGSFDGVVDLLDVDIQGAEADVLTSGADELARVRRVFIGTHGADQERRLRELFGALGWECRSDYASLETVAETWWGGRNVTFEDGVQSWVNPALL